MGTTVSHITAKAQCPILIIKDFQPRAKKEKESYHWVVCTDGSEGSRHAFSNISHMINKEKDTMEILAIKTHGFDTSKLEQHCKIGFEKGGINGKVTIIDFVFGKKVETMILDYLHDEKTKYVDFCSVRKTNE